MDSGCSIRRKADVDELSSVNMARDLPVKELLDLVSRRFSHNLYIFVLIMKRRLYDWPYLIFIQRAETTGEMAQTHYGVSPDLMVSMCAEPDADFLGQC